jgi:hypothetical protein
MPSLKRLSQGLAAAAILTALTAPAAHASTTQQFVIQDDAALRANTLGALTTMRGLGVTIVKVTVRWSSIAPNAASHSMPRHFTASNPASYPAANWAFYDAVVRDAKIVGIKVGFTVTSPAPLWATGSGFPKGSLPGNAYVWKPSAPDFGAFVQAVGKRYSGTYRPNRKTAPLPRVSWWSIWNEPNYGPDLAPQAIDNDTIYTGAGMYRQLLDHAWGALAATGHTPKKDTILIGETAPRGVVGKGFPGNFSGTVPVTFLQTLYCENSANRELTGAAAAANGCPGNAGAVRAQNPALFDASGYAAHLYAQGVPPTIPTYQCGINKFCWNAATKQSNPGYLDFAEVSRLTKLLERLAGHSFPIWNTEFGYWTNPPDSANNAVERREAVSPATAALYMNWAEYLSYENPQIASDDQYLLVDPVSSAFSTGLELNNGVKLATYAAYRTPLFMPVTTATHATSLTVWGAVRPADVLVSRHVKPRAMIQFQAASRGPWTTLQTVAIKNSRGYFDVRVPFKQSGSVRIAWTNGVTQFTSRTQQIKLG